MQDRQAHRAEVQAYLQRNFGQQDWTLSLPQGHGGETYLARSSQRAYFVKLGAQIDRYILLGSLDLAAPVIASGLLPDGCSILVQEWIEGRTPSRQDYREHLEHFAEGIARVHHNFALQQILPSAHSEDYASAGLAALHKVQQKWNQVREFVPQAARWVDGSLEMLAERMERIHGAGLVASHNDICNANWLITSDGRLYLVDLEAMGRDDPALDLGATLWWYYPPDLWQRFLAASGQAFTPEFEHRMWTRLALHCLDITLPRPNSYDRFASQSFLSALRDYRAALDGAENPEMNLE